MNRSLFSQLLPRWRFCALDWPRSRKGCELYRIPGRICPVAWALSILGALLLMACGSKQQPLPSLDISDIVIPKTPAQSRPFGVDVCIDATPSMEGFVADPDSSYRRFLEDLEGSLVSAVRNVSDVRFFKFGETIRQITREESRTARTPGFYHEPGIFRETNVELILKKDVAYSQGDPSSQRDRTAVVKASAGVAPRVTVAVTDLFQRDQDVNVVVRQIKDGCLAYPDCSVGILAVPSAFDGIVYDARVPTYQYRSTMDAATFRPFYLLMFGPQQQLLEFADVLSAYRYIDLSHLLIIGPQIVRTFSVATIRDTAAQGVTSRKASGSGLDSAFNLRKGFSEAKLISRINVASDPRTFSFEPSRVELRAFRQNKGKMLPSGNELTLESVGLTGDSLELKLTIRPPDQKADYLYIGELGVGSINGFVAPRWISEFSSTNPRPDHDPAKTLNLDRLVERLVAASILQDHHRPTLARFRILIHRL
jgi:hypothetical protein